MAVAVLDADGKPIKPEEDTSPILDNDDIFAQAFAQISEADAKLNQEPSPTDKATPAPGAKPETSASDASPGETVVGDEGEPEGLPPTDAEKAAQEAARLAAEAAKKTPEPTSPPMADDEIARRIAALVRNTQPEPEPRSAPPQDQQLPPLFTKEDEDFLRNYNTEYPDIAKAETLLRRAEIIQATRYIFNSISENLRPVVEQVQLLASRTHLGDIQQAVPDYAATREGVIKWVDEQPSYLKAAYEHVVRQGTAEEVADLIRRFKQETGAGTVPDPASQQKQNAPGTRPPVVQQTQQAPVVDQAAQRAIAKLAPVATKRAATGAAGAGKDDFDGAFAEFAKALS